MSRASTLPTRAVREEDLEDFDEKPDELARVLKLALEPDPREEVVAVLVEVAVIVTRLVDIEGPVEAFRFFFFFCFFLFFSFLATRSTT